MELLFTKNYTILEIFCEENKLKTNIQKLYRRKTVLLYGGWIINKINILLQTTLVPRV